MERVKIVRHNKKFWETFPNVNDLKRRRQQSIYYTAVARIQQQPPGIYMTQS